MTNEKLAAKKVEKDTQKVSASSDQRAHRAAVLRAGFLAIAVNLVLFVFKLILSAVSGSLAVLSDALHGLVDTLSGLIVVISEKIKPHALKSGRKLTHTDVERIGSRLIAVIILLVAAHIIIEAISGLLYPEDLNVSIPTLVVLIISMATKIALGLYLRRIGRRTRSDTLRASSVETLNDSIISGAVLASVFIYFIWQINLEAYISLIVAAIIIKSAIDLFRNHKK